MKCAAFNEIRHEDTLIIEEGQVTYYTYVR